jgi:hypothetical protein
MRTICLEIRDSATFIPVMATDTSPWTGSHVIVEELRGRQYLLRRAGYASAGSTIILLNLDDCRASNDPYDWGNSRTMTTAHEYIENNWDELKDGDVIDVEFILGETTVKKVSERFES